MRRSAQYSFGRPIENARSKASEPYAFWTAAFRCRCPRQQTLELCAGLELLSKPDRLCAPPRPRIFCFVASRAFPRL